MSLKPDQLQGLRQSYTKGKLSESDCSPIPAALFETWLKEALNAECDEPNAFTLSTVKENRPRARVVLLKGLYLEGPVFYSNYHSPKGEELGEQGFASATFLWLPLQRQVRIEGQIQKVSAAMSDQYFASRPHGSKIGAIASPQGQVVESRDYLEKLFSDANKKYPEGSDVPRPTHWGGYVILPERWEFWQGRDNRLHDRICYVKNNNQWIKQRLAP
jgi:pyridoxamine 5'-phosphate oxidase